MAFNHQSNQNVEEQDLPSIDKAHVKNRQFFYSQLLPLIESHTVFLIYAQMTDTPHQEQDKEDD